MIIRLAACRRDNKRPDSDTGSRMSRIDRIEGGDMRNRVLIFGAVLLFVCQAALAQFPRGIRDRIENVTAKYKDIDLTDQEEVQLGADISSRIRAKFGVVQDPEIHRYVTLVGMVLVKKCSRPGIPYQFI